MAQVHDEQALEATFASIFSEPSSARMVNEIDPYQFEDFVGYVFGRAGYRVEDVANQHKDGLDLKLYVGAVGEMPQAGVSVKQFQTSTLVNAIHVTNFQGGLGHIGNPTGYLVTTSEFNNPALEAVKKPPKVWPIDGSHFTRYINYVRGSRAVAAADTESDNRLRANPLAPIPPEVLLAADDIKRRSVQQTKVLTLANHKGGVGKTTTAINLAFGLAAMDQQVLLVDMDAQANLTRVLPTQAPNATALDIGDYFSHRRSLPEIIRQTQFKRVWLVPSSNALIFSDAGMAAGPGAELRFVRDMHAPEVAPPHVLDSRPFDWIILDTGPSMGFFTRAAIAASHYVLMPIAPSVFTDLGANLLVNTVQAMSALVGGSIAILGSLVTQWKEDDLHKALLGLAKPHLEGTGIPLFTAMIPLDKGNIENAYLEAGSGQPKTLFSHHKKSKAAQGYGAAVSEVVNHVQPGPESQARAGATSYVHA